MANLLEHIDSGGPRIYETSHQAVSVPFYFPAAWEGGTVPGRLHHILLSTLSPCAASFLIPILCC